MLKTSPRWSKWLSSDNNNTCPSRVDTQKDNGADNSAPSPDVFINQLESEEVDDKNKTSNVKRKKTLISRRVSKVSDIDKGELDYYAEQTMDYKGNGWELEGDEEKLSGNINRTSKSFDYET